MTKFCVALPKIELHAHLSGSVRESTVIALLEEEHKRKLDSTTDVKEAVHKEMQTFKLGDRNLEECFEVFTILHRLLDNAATVSHVAKEVISDFAADGVVYLELRTTPRAVPATKMSKRSYLDTVIAAIQDCEKRLPITVRLILSVDRCALRCAALLRPQLCPESMLH